jgi:hypothetical protein
VELIGSPKTDSPFRSKNITAGVASQDELSYLRRFYDIERKLIYPYMTAIIDVSGGTVKGITWDDACVFCDDNKCEENTVDYNGKEATQSSSGQPTKGCYISQSDCDTKTIEKSGTDCDLLVYVVWTGTDSDGKTFQSAANRFSTFESSRVQDRISDNQPDVPDNNGDLGRRDREL